MALTTYAELQTAIVSEVDRSGDAALVAAVPDLIKRAEAKLNRRLRLREMETQATATYAATNTTRRIANPTGLLEMLSLWIKPASAADTQYRLLRQVTPAQFAKYYSVQGDVTHFVMRSDIELNAVVGADHTLQMHYFKRLDIATDSTNWLLTNYPDAYLYGALVEYLSFDAGAAESPNAPLWPVRLAEVMEELNALDNRSRDDAELDNRQAVALAGHRRGRFNVLKGV